MAMSLYEGKLLQRSIDIMHNMGISYERARVGMLNDKRAICLLLDRFTKEEEIDELTQKLQKSFPKAEVVRGQGAHRPYAPELKYPNIYIILNGEEETKAPSDYGRKILQRYRGIDVHHGNIFKRRDLW